MQDVTTSMDNPPPCDACGEQLVNVVQVPPQSNKTILECKNPECPKNGVRIDNKDINRVSDIVGIFN